MQLALQGYQCGFSTDTITHNSVTVSGNVKYERSCLAVKDTRGVCEAHLHQAYKPCTGVAITSQTYEAAIEYCRGLSAICVVDPSGGLKEIAGFPFICNLLQTDAYSFIR